MSTVNVLVWQVGTKPLQWPNRHIMVTITTTVQIIKIIRRFSAAFSMSATKGKANNKNSVSIILQSYLRSSKFLESKHGLGIFLITLRIKSVCWIQMWKLNNFMQVKLVFHSRIWTLVLILLYLPVMSWSLICSSFLRLFNWPATNTRRIMSTI